MKKSPVLALLLSAALIAAVPAFPQTPEAARSSAIATRVAGAMERTGAPGVSLAAWKGGEVVYAEGFGLARIADSVPATAETLYRTASVAKPMTATVVLSLAEEGAIDLDASIRKYCPRFPEKRWPVTARQLLGHTAGVRHPTDAEDETTRRYDTVEEALAVFSADSLLHEPGTESTYSSLGYMVLACAVEGATGRPWMAVLEERVLEPVGMTSTTRDTVSRADHRRALGYRKGADGEIEPSLAVDTSFKLAAGGLVSNVVDLARFGGAILEGDLLTAESERAMFSPVVLPDGEHTPFGLGWQVGSMMGHEFAIVAGQQEEVTSILLLVPAADLAVALQSNLERHAEELVPLVVAVTGAIASEDADRPATPRERGDRR